MYFNGVTGVGMIYNVNIPVDWHQARLYPSTLRVPCILSAIQASVSAAFRASLVDQNFIIRLAGGLSVLLSFSPPLFSLSSLSSLSSLYLFPPPFSFSLFRGWALRDGKCSETHYCACHSILANTSEM